jgi:hypothetical protein
MSPTPSAGSKVSPIVHQPRWDLSILVETRETPLPILDRMSGLPLGFPAELWPACEVCHAPLAFIGQFACDPARLVGPSPKSVVYAFLCANPQTRLECHLWQLEPRQQKIGRAVVVEPKAFTFTPAPGGLPTTPAIGLVAVEWTSAHDEEPPANDDWDYLDEAAKEAIRRHDFLLNATRIGGRPRWRQDPFFQNDREHPERFEHRAEWLSYVPVPTQLRESAWLGEQVARVKTERVRYLDSELRVAGWGLKVRAFDSPDYVLLDGTMIRREPDGISTVDTSLDSGTLYLLADTIAGGFELYYIGR